MPMPLAPTISSSPGAPRAMPGANRAGLVRKASSSVAIWPIVLVIYTTLIPREMSIHVGENFIYMDRLALLLTLPWVLQHLLRGVIKFVVCDWLVLFTAVWMVSALWVVHGFERALISGLSLSFDAVAGYYLARVSFRSLDDMRRVLIICAPAFFVAAVSLPVESLTQHLYVRPFFASIFGGIHYASGTDNINDALRNDVRFGLMRAYGPWVHPILAGLHLATLLGIYWKSSIRGWPLWLAVAAAGMSVFTVSSAGVLALGLIIGALAYDWLTTRVKQLSWPLLMFALAVSLVVISLVTKSGIIALLIRFVTLDPATGYFRVAIWQFGSESVWAHPWFGIGFDAYERPQWMLTSSVDALWLLYAMRFGLPASLSLLLACIFAVAGLVRAEKMANVRDASFYRGIMISLIVLVIMAFTVALQGGILTWFTILLGGCVACSQHTYTSDWTLRAKHFLRKTMPTA